MRLISNVNSFLDYGAHSQTRVVSTTSKHRNFFDLEIFSLGLTESDYKSMSITIGGVSGAIMIGIILGLIIAWDLIWCNSYWRLNKKRTDKNKMSSRK